MSLLIIWYLKDQRVEENKCEGGRPPVDPSMAKGGQTFVPSLLQKSDPAIRSIHAISSISIVVWMFEALGPIVNPPHLHCA
uniref:Uncharacterized protein n=1 Tax=Pristionchus pacificus TaxID=54126 RepID=A0A2A6C5E6_PRIPA|eukprot:PDM73442.1 hypothetical protein PRIPAC_40798 [Pristionchus pacificus]